MSLGPQWFTVIQRGFDSSGRPLRATRLMWAVWDAAVDDPRCASFRHLLVPVQGAFMGSGGASASDGFHSLAACMDWRTWNLTSTQSAVFNYVLREHGAGSWRRQG